MNSCDTVNEWLDAMVDGDLGPEDSASVEEHLRSCAACRAELEGLHAVKRAAAALPRELSPPRDLWEGIEDRLELRKPPRWRLNPAAIAAAAAIVAAVALGVLLAPGRSAAPQYASVETPAPSFAHVSYESTPVADFRAEYEQARADLLTVIDNRRDQLAPETLAVIESNMQLIDQAITDIERALADRPGEASLDRRLQLVYRQQIDLLRWAARLSA